MAFTDPVTGERFFGRSSVLSLLRKRIDGLKGGYRQNVAIIGQEHLGKSSILQQFLSTFTDNRIIPIYLEVKRGPFKHFARKFTASLLYNFVRTTEAFSYVGENIQSGTTKGKLSSIVEGRSTNEANAEGEFPLRMEKEFQETIDRSPVFTAKDKLEPLITTCQKFIPHTVETIDEVRRYIKEGDFDSAYITLLNLPSMLNEETRRPCVVILDEFHRFDTFEVKNPFSELGNKIMVQKTVMYIVTSSNITRAKQILTKELSLLFGNFEVIELEPFDCKSADEFIRQRVKHTEVPKNFREFLIAFTNGHPFYLDILTQKIEESARGSVSKGTPFALISQVFDSVLFDSKGILNQYFAHFLERLVKDCGSAEHTVSILLSIASGRNKLKEITESIGISKRNISTSLSLMVRKNFISKNGVFYRINDRAFKFWLKAVYQKREQSVTPHLSELSESFKYGMKEQISSFASESKKNIYQRLIDLFKSFKNEIVEIDNRRSGLPCFADVSRLAIEGNHHYIIGYKIPNRSHCWVARVEENEVTENEVAEFTHDCKAVTSKVQRKILIALDGVQLNAKLLAKEEKVWMWDLGSLSVLLELYGKPQIVR